MEECVNNYNILQNVGELFGFSKTDKKKILQKNLTQIEIEIFSYCNRQCWFCPNSYIDRHTENIFMDEITYFRILEQLSEIGYSNIITYSRYNEPLSQKDNFLKRLKQARLYCPDAFLRTNSNGDFLTSAEYLDLIAEAGLNEIDVQCYLNKGEKFSQETFEVKTENFAKRFGLNYRIENYGEWMRAFLDYQGLNLTYSMHDFENIANNRGESLSEVKDYCRKEACLVPFQHIYVDYTGDVMLCCNLRHDIVSHKDFILGNVKKDRLEEIFMSEKLINFRKRLCCENINLSPCDTCRFYVEQSKMNLAENKEFAGEQWNI